MKNTMKSIVVACVATLSLGVQNGTAKAINESMVQNEGKLPLMEQQNEITNKDKDVKQDIILNRAMVSIGEISQPLVLPIHSAEPIIQAAEKATDIVAEPTKAETVESASQPAEPEVETAVEEPATPAVSISDNETNLFARLVEAEAKGEPYEGKVAVATVVLNRVESPEFPDSVTGVINEVVGGAYAFSPVQNGEINKPASEESMKAVKEALKKEDTLDNSIYFYNPDIATDDWIRSRETVETIGNHVFAK